MPHGVDVRKAHQHDLAVLLSLYGELAEGDPAREPAGPDAAGATLEAMLSDQCRHPCVGLLDGQVVGAAELVIVSGLTHRGRPWAVVENVIVAGHARRRGVASAMVRHLLDTAQRAGCYKAQLHSGKQRVEAHALYRHLGFAPVAEGFKYYLDDTAPRWHDPG
ncbi:MAG: GNAT family N-acetyltransferase [Actinomycetes bacterium]